MSNRIDPRQQFSKKLAWWTALFWFFYMTWLSVLMMLQPSVAVYSVYMGIITTVVMMVNVISYTRNSVAEKLALTLLDKTKIELSMSNGKTETSDTNTDTEEEGGEDDG